MLKGQNQLRLNEATMMAAIEEYLNNRIAEPEDDLNVWGVTMVSEPSGKWFLVQTREKDTE